MLDGMETFKIINIDARLYMSFLTNLIIMIQQMNYSICPFVRKCVDFLETESSLPLSLNVISQFCTVRCSLGMDAAPASASNKNLEPSGTCVGKKG